MRDHFKVLLFCLELIVLRNLCIVANLNVNELNAALTIRMMAFITDSKGKYPVKGTNI